MPNQHRHPNKGFRPDPELYERAKIAVGQVDSTITAHLAGFLSWLVGDTDELPERPPKPIPAKSRRKTAPVERAASTGRGRGSGAS
ncbi:hypothetical protein [Nocardia sp. NPDC004722]